MKICIFGTGKIYNRYKDRLKSNVEIVCLIDNNKDKIGTYIDGIRVVSPNMLKNLEYDYICILSVYEEDMRKQLRDLGVNPGVIILWERCELFFKRDKYDTYFMPENSGNKNLLIFSHALTSTGAQNMQLTMVELLEKKSFNIRVVSKYDGPLREKLLSIGASVILMDDYCAENPKFIELIKWSDLVIINTMWLYYVIQEIDKLVIHNVVKDINVKWWIHEYGSIHNIENKEFERLISLPYIYVYVVSDWLKRKLQKHCVVSDGITDFIFGIRDYYKLEKTKINNEIMTFAIIGYICELKGQDIFIDMVKKLPAEYRQKSRFLIVGPGELTDSQKQDVENIPQIIVTGEIPNEDIYKVYDESDVIVSCSREDSMSVVVLEGFMNRKPAIVSDEVGAADFITDGVEGFIVKSEDVEGFAQKVMWMIDHRQECKYMGIRARNIYENTFTIDKFKERVDKIFLADV